MINYEFKDRDNNTWVRVNKRTTAKLFYKCKDIVLCSSNLRPFSMFNPQYETNLMNKPNEYVFTDIVANYKYYNCTDAYTGRNVFYYARKEDIA